nr:hypothetical protein CFP56_66653 [Quercus suber]
MAHGDSGLFPSSTHSSGELCGSELLCVVWLRFGQAKDDTTPKEEEGMARTLSAPTICVAVVEVQREGSRGSRGEGMSFCLRAGLLSSFCLESVWIGV